MFPQAIDTADPSTEFALGTLPSARVPDVDGDGVDDVAFAATGLTDEATAAALGVFVFVADGPRQQLFRFSTPAPALHWPPPAGSVRFGSSISNGDLNGDGDDDIAIGSDGAVYVALSGNFDTLVELARPTVAPIDVDADARFGASVAPFLSSSGVRGLAIGAPDDNGGEGSVALARFSGATLQVACVSRGSAGAHLGAALRGLGPTPTSATAGRLAVGAPGEGNGAGAAFILDIDLDDCADAFAAPLEGTSAAGDRFGAAFGQ